MDRGIVPIWRKLEDNPVWEDNVLLSLWVRLLFMASFKEETFYLGNTKVKKNIGDIITSYPSLAKKTKIKQTTLLRKLKVLEMERMVETQSERWFTRITICNYSDYRDAYILRGKVRGKASGNETERERKGNGKGTETVKEVKEVKEVKNKTVIHEIVSHLNGILGTKYKASTASTGRAISGRLSEGYSLEDFKTVHIKKHREWSGTEQQKYLTPSTLYRQGNFEKYLNQSIHTEEPTSSGPTLPEYRGHLDE